MNLAVSSLTPESKQAEIKKRVKSRILKSLAECSMYGLIYYTEVFCSSTIP